MASRLADEAPKTDSPGGESSDGILFKRVALGERDKKARVVTVNGDVAEIVTEGDWRQA